MMRKMVRRVMDNKAAGHRGTGSLDPRVPIEANLPSAAPAVARQQAGEMNTMLSGSLGRAGRPDLRGPRKTMLG
jgi:hypothetical protein